MFKIYKKNCCGLDVHKTWIFACIGITDENGLTDYKRARFSAFTKGLRELVQAGAVFGVYERAARTGGLAGEVRLQGGLYGIHRKILDSRLQYP